MSLFIDRSLYEAPFLRSRRNATRAAKLPSRWPPLAGLTPRTSWLRDTPQKKPCNRPVGEDPNSRALPPGFGKSQLPIPVRKASGGLGRSQSLDLAIDVGDTVEVQFHLQRDGT